MELTVLGCSGSFPTAYSACSGYLLRHDGFTIWMDAGNGTLVELQKHVALHDVDAVVLSHVHPDHCADMYPYFYAHLFPRPERPIPVYSPPGVHDKLELLVGFDSKDLFNGQVLQWREHTPGQTTEIGPFRFEFFDAAHSAPNLTMRIAADRRVLCYSGDTGPNDALADAARDADLFLCEASWLDEHRGLMGPIHLTAGEAGEAGKRAAVDRLVLTHIWPTNDLTTVRAQAEEAFGADVELALDQGSMTI